MERKVVSLKQQVAIQTKLQSVLVCISPGIYSYEDGVNDAEVAKSMEFPCTITNVRFVRNELFGSLFKATTQREAKASVRDKIAELEARIAALELKLRGL